MDVKILCGFESHLPHHLIMKIKTTITVDADLDSSEVERIAIEFLCDRFNWNLSYFIEDDFVCKNTWCGSSNHGFNTVSRVREASKLDVSIFELLKQIKYEHKRIPK